MSIILSKTARDAWYETWHREAMHDWLNSTMAPCNECGCLTQVQLIDLVWLRKDGSGQVIVQTLCMVCHDMYRCLMRDNFSEDYWIRITTGLPARTRAAWERDGGKIEVLQRDFFPFEG